MSYERERKQLNQMIWGNSGQPEILKWRNIVECSEEILQRHGEHAEVNAELRARLATILWDVGYEDEARNFDTETLLRLDLSVELLDSEVGKAVLKNIEDRHLGQHEYRGIEAVERRHEESEQHGLQAGSHTSCTKHQTFSPPLSTRMDSGKFYGLSSSSGKDPPPDPFRPWGPSVTRQVRPSPPNALPISTQAISERKNTPPQVRTPTRPPRRSASVADLGVEESNPNTTYQPSAVDDISLPAYKTFRKEQFLSEDSIANNTLQKRADQWFQNLENLTHNFIYGEKSKWINFPVLGKRYTKVKIAILDTGVSLSTLKSYKRRFKEMKSFLPGEKDSPTAGRNDESGHGTAVASLLLKVSDTAEIYVARVARWNEEGESWDIDKDAVADALDEAVEKWRVDIINMSFGWDFDDHPRVHKALGKAKGADVLLFAATSNFGISPPNDILYPARSSEVIAVDAADGLGNPAGFNPSSEVEAGKERFTTLGMEVMCNFPSKSGVKRMSGVSFSSPIAAGIAALVLEFSRQPPLGFDPDINSYLKRADDMRLIFGLMGKQKGASRLKNLCPWAGPLLSLRGGNRDIYGGDELVGSERFTAAVIITSTLKKAHGSDIGQKMTEEVKRIMGRHMESTAPHN